MKRLIVICLIGGLFTACVTARTKYHPVDESGGYTEKNIDDGLAIVRFAGDSKTKLDEALLFSRFRAVESCREKGFKIAIIYGSEDKSVSNTVQHSNANSYNSGFGLSEAGSTTWNETYHYPIVDTVFECVNEAFIAMLKLRPISPENTKPFAKDLMGSIQVEGFLDNSPNRGILEAGDFIIRVNDSRVQSLQGFNNEIRNTKDKNRIKMSIIRDGKPLVVRAKAIQGVSLIEELNNRLILDGCSLSELEKRTVCSSIHTAARNSSPLSKHQNEESSAKDPHAGKHWTLFYGWIDNETTK